MTPLPDQSEQSLNGLAILIERVTPMLVDIGSWIFGGLIALNLVIIAALITVGPAHRLILISLTAFTCALPLDVAGIFLLRLTKDLKDVEIERVALRSFKDAGFPNIEAYFPDRDHRAAAPRRRSRLAVVYCLAIGTVTSGLTVAGLTAALWYMAWWIGVTLLAMIVAGALVVIAAFAHSLPPQSEAEQELKRRMHEEQSQ